MKTARLVSPKNPRARSTLKGLPRSNRNISRDLNSPCHHLPYLILLHISPRRLRIMGEDGQPFLRDRFCVVLLLALKGLQRVEVEGHAPSDVDVRRRGNEGGNRS